MSNAVILYENKAEAASLFTSGAIPSLPVVNLLEPQPRKGAGWAASSAYVEADLGSAAPLGMVVVHGTNLTAAATRRVRLATSQANLTASPLHDSGTAAAGADSRYMGSFAYLLSADVSAQWLRIDVSDVSLSEIFLGLLLAGQPLRPSANFAFGWGLGLQDYTQKFRSDIGLTHIKPVDQKARVINLRYDAVSEADAFSDISLLEMQRLAGTGKNVAFMTDPTGAYKAKQLVVGTVEALEPISNPLIDLLFSQSFILTERL
jgi:hypothetical protein